MELLNKLGIDWKILVAQIINFFILLAVLYKFVYKPVLDALDKRSKTIEKGMRDAKLSEEKLQEIEQLRNRRIAETEKEVGGILEKAKQDAENIKKDLLAAAQTQSEDLLRRTKIQIEEQKQAMIEQVKAEITLFIVKATGKILQREFTQDDQKRLASAITNEMQTL